jgi:hypothetical protein
MDADKLTSEPPRRLDGFSGYDRFVEYAENLFELTPEELEGLYEVLLKLQGIGEDPMETMALWKAETCKSGCPEFIRFLIQVNDLDLEALQVLA